MLRSFFPVNFQVTTIIAYLLLYATTHALGQSAQLRVTETKTVVSRQQVCTPAGCRIINVQNQKEFIYLGMSVCLGQISQDEWLFATCSHNFGMSGTIKVLCQGGWTDGKFVARTNHKNTKVDLALIKVRHAGELKCASLADGPQIGLPASYVTRSGTRNNAHVVSDTELRGRPPIQGDSGTAVFNDREEVIGILWGGRPNEIHYTPVAELRIFILDKIGKLPTCGDKIDTVIPSPPKEEDAPASVQYDHTDILGRLTELEKRKTFDPSNLIIANEKLRNQIVKLENRVEGFENSVVFRVVFAAGDDPDEPETVVSIKRGGTLVIPPQGLRVRIVDEHGNKIGSPVYDIAPLGKDIQIKFVKPLSVAVENP